MERSLALLDQIIERAISSASRGKSKAEKRAERKAKAMLKQNMDIGSTVPQQQQQQQCPRHLTPIHAVEGGEDCRLCEVPTPDYDSPST